jgi:putative transcriptional regulator
MNATHHIPSNVLTAYAAGSHPEAFSLVVACHLSMCDACRAEVESLDAVGGSVLENLPKAPLDEGAFAATLALIAKGPATPLTPPVRPAKKLGGVFPRPLQDYAGEDPGKVKWRSVGGGVRQAILDCKGPSTARLLFIPAGKAVPDHSHEGLELTLVLQGSFSDKVARFARGDVEVGTDDLTHTPIADVGEDCICLAAADAPLKFNALIPRLLQPFIRI